jgi:O-antigen/teichoic acid export membrane protein
LEKLKRIFATGCAGAIHHRAALASLAMRGCGVAAGFIVTFIIGRTYGPAANGQYAIVTQTAMFLSIIAVGGLDVAVAREFSRTAAVGLRLAMSTFLRSLIQAIGVAALIAGILLVSGTRLLAVMGRDAVPAGAVGALCLILFCRTATRFLAAVLRSQSAFVLAQAVEVLLIPLGTIFLLKLGVSHSIRQILWATAAAGIVSASIGFVSSLRYTSRGPAAMTVATSALFAVALPLWGAAITQNLSDWYVLATISRLDGVYQAGLFRVTAQFASVFSLVSTGLYGSFGTQISTAYHRHDRAEIARLAGSATRLSAALVVPVAAFFIVFAPSLLGIIAPEFRQGSMMLRVLVIGQVGVSLASPAGLVLALTGHPKVNFSITAISAILMLFIAPLAVAEFGTVGVAAWMATVLIGQNMISHLFVRRLEGIDVLRGRVHKQSGSN